MEGFRFILENPHPNASSGKQRKRARLVTACDSCRVKKIKCQQPSPNGRCEACKTAKTPCLFGDRDRYQAERGVTCTWNTPVEEVSPSPEPSSRKRKVTYSPYPTATASSSWKPSAPTSTSSTAIQSRSGTPAGGSLPYFPYLPAQQAGPSSFVHDFNVHPRTAPPSPEDTSSYQEVPLFDPHRPRFPHPQRMHQLGALFFDTIGSHFPFLDRFDILHRIEQRTCSAILSNCIAGLAVRFADPSRPNLKASAPYYNMAKTLAAHVVSVPSVEALHALICITWAEYGSSRDDGFWMYSRMAIAMCLDLGLGNEATIQVAATPEVRHRLRLTWWMVVCMADIAASCATGRPASLELDHHDTALPQAVDDASFLFRYSTELFLLRGKLTRILDTHLENQGDSSLDWDLSELQGSLETISSSLPTALMFNKGNLRRLTERQLGHVFVQMHLLIHAVGALINRPSLLPSYGLPVPADGPRAEAARASAKAIVDILIEVQETVPHLLCDPFMDLSILVASRTFMAEAVRSSDLDQFSQQWTDPFLNKCKESIVRLSAACGGYASFEIILGQHGGTLADDLQLAGSSSTTDLFTLPNSSVPWLLKPSLVDDGGSDTSSSFRSSSRELSPHPPAGRFASSKQSAFPVGPLMAQGVDGSPTRFPLARDTSFDTSDLFVPGPLEPEMFELEQHFSSSGAELPLSVDSTNPHRTLNLDMYSRRGIEDTKLSPSSLFPSLSWLTRV